MATGSNIRVGDADRDATATQLREHYAAGRLTLDELNERLEQTFAARTGADLNAVMRDLPSLDGAWARARGPAADSSLGAPLLRNDQGQWDQGQGDQGQWDQGGPGGTGTPRWACWSRRCSRSGRCCCSAAPSGSGSGAAARWRSCCCSPW